MLPDSLRHWAHSIPHEARLHSGEQLGHVNARIAACWGVRLLSMRQCSTCLSTLTQ